MHSRSVVGRLTSLGVVLVVLLAVSATAQQATPEPATEQDASWRAIDQLVSEQKFQEAIDQVAAVREQARADGDDAALARALISEVQLRTGLHGYETAVRFLRQEVWPETPRFSAMVELYYGQCLFHYLSIYGWEIGQREQVVSREEIDLKAWTQEQILAEAHAAFAHVWGQRASWGSESLGELALYFEGNTYPARIRGTLRDSVTYLWVQLLGNTGFWRPAFSNEIYKLDLEAHLNAAVGDIDVADSAVHPLTRIAAILGDLDGWHRSEQRPEAAFEARLELLRHLRTSFTGATSRQSIREQLQEDLDGLGQQYAWWSMGMAELAELLQEGEADSSLIEAREVALSGRSPHPQSLGGRRCDALIRAIEAPDYSLQSMMSDGSRRRSILVQHKNLEELHFRAFRLDPLRAVERSRDYNLLPAYREVPQILEERAPTVEWSVELPATPDYRQHRTFVTPPIDEPGLYVVVSSERRDFARRQNRRAAVNLLVTDLVVLRQHAGGRRIEVTVRSGATGDALAGVEVRLYRGDWQNGHRVVANGLTDTDGVVELEGESREEVRGQRYFVAARHGAEVALDPQFFWGGYSDDPDGETTGSLVYTDRSVYRPLQTLQWKVVAYRGDGKAGSFEVLSSHSVNVELRDANNDVVATESVTTNEFGSASGTFRIPSGRLLGAWRLWSSYGGNSMVRVEEYKRPTFEVTLDEPETALRLNRPATLGGEVRYYFGLPVSEGSVSWRVWREPIYPPFWYWFRHPTEGPQIVDFGSGPLDAAGRFAVTFTPEAEEPTDDDRGLSYRYRLEVDASDVGGETRSASRSFRLGFVAVEARVEDDSGFATAGAPLELTLRRTDLDGTPRPGQGTWRLVRLVQPPAVSLPADIERFPEPVAGSLVTEGDAQRARWETQLDTAQILRTWGEGETLRRGTVQHGEEGRAVIALAPLTAGTYRLAYETRDDYGAAFDTTYDFLVVAPAAALALPLALTAEHSSVPVGGAIRLLVHSGLADQELVLESYQGEERIERRTIRSTEGLELLEIPVLPRHRGGLTFTLTGVRDHQLLRAEQRILVPWDDRKLAISYETFRDRLRPEEEETFRVRIESADGHLLEQGSAEVLAYMYDKSLELFAPHTPPEVLSIYPNRWGYVGVLTSLGVHGEAWRQFSDRRGRSPAMPRADQLRFFTGYGIGGVSRNRSYYGARGVLPGVVRKLDSYSAAEMVMEETDALESRTAGLAESVAQGASPRLVAAEAEAPVELRTDFSETAFWQPHLLVGEDGAVAFEFTVPDSVTEWNLWVHAVTRDLRGGSLEKQVKTTKELLVRPYLTRFFREGDEAELKVVVNNAGETELSGELTFDIFDPETDSSLLADFGLTAGRARKGFTVEAGGGTSLSFPVTVPSRLGTIAIRATARAGDWSDGELRPLPILPGRFHLTQSRFSTLRGAESRTLHFADLEADDDPTRLDEQLVVTLEAQLFYGVLNALPYLVDYPYECSEQTLNRFLSTGIVSTLFDQYPAVARMARQLAARDTRFERFDEPDPNRTMQLEESPWLWQSRGGQPDGQELIRVLDPEIARAQRQTALAKLQKAQTSLGAFPWWPGGPPSPYMTLYILDGFSRALEFGIEVPQDVVQRAWAYMHRHYVDEIVRDHIEADCCWETVTYLNYVLSSYPDVSWTGDVWSDDDRRVMLDFSFRHWREHAPRLKAYLALTLDRAGRAEDARLVFDSILDSSRTTRDEGTFWAPEDRAWLWYNDTIESQAFVLRALTELMPQEERRHGLVQWLFLNKKLNHWKSTRATAEVIYALVHYLEGEGTLGVREAATVRLGDQETSFVWEPDEYTGGRNQVVVAGADIEPAEMSRIVVEKETPGLLFASATWHFSTEKLPEEAAGDFFAVERRYFKRSFIGDGWQLEPLTEGAPLRVGDQVEVQLSITSRHAAEYVHLRDPRAAGFEPETTTSGFHWNLGVAWYEEVRDSGTNFFFEQLPAGQYAFKYRLRAAVAGSFKAAPATMQSMYAPEFAAYSSGALLEIAP